MRRRISDAISQHYCGVHRGQRGRLSRKVLHHRANLARAGHRRNRIPTLWKRRSRKGLLPSSDIHPVPLQGRLDVAQLHVGCISTDGGRRLYLHRQIKINISRSAVPEMIMCRPRDTPNAIVSFLLLGRALADALSFSFQNSVQSTPGPSTPSDRGRPVPLNSPYSNPTDRIRTAIRNQLAQQGHVASRRPAPLSRMRAVTCVRRTATVARSTRLSLRRIRQSARIGHVPTPSRGGGWPPMEISW